MALDTFRAKLLHQFTHRWATYEGEAARDITTNELTNSSKSVTPRYWVPTTAVAERLAGRWDRTWLIGFRNIVRVTDERTSIFGFLPLVAVGHSMPLMYFSSYTRQGFRRAESE
ncbi:hypothetical protein K2Z83_27750 [Oscillochloris sp. ZM17-4]|uniref:hypothetical protein n=1 Tax=Oscillochloris sp. ZM17-4 TaxID=2866714 RepID=UPI001C72C946|nr:hypothetical protein [Oscillochloris sp. ZM17-4]MBX0331452.1 hypothetical protein [Oscillochloris sp. ZM17-4]